MRRSSLEDHSLELQEFFDDENGLKMMFCKAQRIIWEKLLFPNRFLASFKCKHCSKKPAGLGICLSCGNIYCKEYMIEHECKKKYAVDIDTLQLYKIENRQRKFLFHTKLDHLTMSAKFAVIDQIPLSAELSYNQAILPFPAVPRPIQYQFEFKQVGTVLQAIFNDQTFLKFFLSLTVTPATCTSIYQAIYKCMSKMCHSYITGSSLPISEFFSVLSNIPYFMDPNVFFNSQPSRFLKELMLALSKHDPQNFRELFGIKITTNFKCGACASTKSINDYLFILETKENQILQTIQQGSQSTLGQKCSTCQAPMDILSTSYKDFPPSLIVESAGKDSHPLHLELENIGKKYALNSIIVLEDDQNLTTMIRKFGIWYKFADNVVQEVNESVIKNSHPILLFYSQEYDTV